MSKVSLFVVRYLDAMHPVLAGSNSTSQIYDNFSREKSTAGSTTIVSEQPKRTRFIEPPNFEAQTAPILKSKILNRQKQTQWEVPFCSLGCFDNKMLCLLSFISPCIPFAQNCAEIELNENDNNFLAKSLCGFVSGICCLSCFISGQISHFWLWKYGQTLRIQLPFVSNTGKVCSWSWPILVFVQRLRFQNKFGMGYKDVPDDCIKSCLCPCLSIYHHSVELKIKKEHNSSSNFDIESLPSTVKIQPWKSPNFK